MFTSVVYICCLPLLVTVVVYLCCLRLLFTSVVHRCCLPLLFASVVYLCCLPLLFTSGGGRGWKNKEKQETASNNDRWDAKLQNLCLRLENLSFPKGTPLPF
jgi:hypothetical protein